MRHMLGFNELIRNVLIIVLVMIGLSWLISLIRVTLAVRQFPGGKQELFERLLAVLKDQDFAIKVVDPTKGRIVTEGLVNVIDVIVYGVIGNRIVFQLTELSAQEVQLRIRAHASFLFCKLGIRKSERDKVIDDERIGRVLNSLVRA